MNRVATIVLTGALGLTSFSSNVYAPVPNQLVAYLTTETGHRYEVNGDLTFMKINTQSGTLVLCAFAKNVVGVPQGTTPDKIFDDGFDEDLCAL